MYTSKPQVTGEPQIERPMSTRNLHPSEKRFTEFIQKLEFGRLEFLRIQRGELVLDPWPMTVQQVKFATRECASQGRPAEFELKNQLAQLFEYIRAIDDGEIRCLEIRHGIPFSMEVERGVVRVGESFGV